MISALGFVAVFSYLAATFDYPDILDGAPSEVLPRLLEGGVSLHVAWWLYAMLPLLLLPAAAGAFEALRSGGEGLMRLASYCAVLAALTLTLGLVRWPSLNHELAVLHSGANATQRVAVEAIFAGFNRYLGTYVGEQLGELFMNVWFILCGVAMLRIPRFLRWLGRAGIVVGLAGLVGMFRFTTHWVEVVSELNNYILPLWLIGFGLTLWTRGPAPAPEGSK
ncbi:MAG: DUF4386 family protein [Gemmatimonadota bacterium]